MLGSFTYAALLPELRDLWALSNSQAGVIGGVFFAGYVATVSLWTALTDRVDGRWIYATGSALTVAGSAGFGLFADGFVSAIVFQVLLGTGIAGTYMPGLRLLSDRLSGPMQSRYVASYTAFFGIGTALSYAIPGFMAPVLGWRAAFVFVAVGPLLAGLLVFFGLSAKGKSEEERKNEDAIKGEQKAKISLETLFPVRAWRRVLADRACAGYTLGYAVHCLELFGSRAWMVAFLAFSSSLHTGSTFPWPAAAIAAVVNLFAVPASIFGNEVALRIGRRRWILIAMVASGASGLLLALGAAWHWSLVIFILVAYSMLVMAESGTLTAGLVAAAPGELRGAAMGLYSLIGFGGGMLGPVVFGAALDAAGGASSWGAWIAGYAAIGAGVLAAPLVVRRYARG